LIILNCKIFICIVYFAGKRTDAVGSPGYIPTIFTKARVMRGYKVNQLRQTKRAAKAGYVPTNSKTPVKKRSRKLASTQPATLGRPKLVLPAQEQVFHRRAVWVSDHDYVKTLAVHGPMTELEYVHQKCEELKELNEKISQSPLSLNALTDDDYPLLTNLPNKAVFDALCSYLKRRRVHKVCIQAQIFFFWLHT
jgi:hypothetical protein